MTALYCLHNKFQRTDFKFKLKHRNLLYTIDTNITDSLANET